MDDQDQEIFQKMENKTEEIIHVTLLVPDHHIDHDHNHKIPDHIPILVHIPIPHIVPIDPLLVHHIAPDHSIHVILLVHIHNPVTIVQNIKIN